MSNLYWPSEDQMARLRRYFPKSHGIPRVDDRRVLYGSIFFNLNGLQWCDAPKEYGPSKTLYNRWKRWRYVGVFARMMMGLAAEAPDNQTISIDATYLNAHRTPSNLRLKKGGRGRFIGRTKGGMNTKLHAVTDTIGLPIRLFMTAGRVSDYTGVRALVNNLSKAVQISAAQLGHLLEGTGWRNPRWMQRPTKAG
ncbi:IS5 family transposase [uncultured Sulfitobacter sp.]|uniref:IS5 family transposase n=1 Tax=uncultured Sulfitobacter sp. TaxID=191468 RepID=UPI00259A1B8D|nr:IS5 family transposase [uncultured Sulfitobacter sp.]